MRYVSSVDVLIYELSTTAVDAAKTESLTDNQTLLTGSMFCFWIVVIIDENMSRLTLTTSARLIQMK